jgi:hypothetical protein
MYIFLDSLFFDVKPVVMVGGWIFRHVVLRPHGFSMGNNNPLAMVL